MIVAGGEEVVEEVACGDARMRGRRALRRRERKAKEKRLRECIV